MPSMRVLMLLSGPGAMDFANSLTGHPCKECGRPTTQSYGDVKGTDADGNVVFSYGDVSRPNENGSMQWKMAADAFVYDVQQMAVKSEWPNVQVAVAPVDGQPLPMKQAPEEAPKSVNDQQMAALAAAKQAENDRIKKDAERKAAEAPKLPPPTPFVKPE